jgi:Kef-type K+ transport system membrane component KefB
MPEVEFVNLFAVVLEIVAGIVVGPSVLGWVDAVLPCRSCRWGWRS